MKKLISALYFGVAIVVALLLSTNVPSNAQTITASVVGTVTDASGAAIPGATVTVTNVATNQNSTTATNSAGEYNIRFLQVGQYTLSIKAPAFATRTFAAFALEADQEARMDATLSIKGSQEQVTVTDTAPLINTEDASLGTTLDSTAVNSLPLNGRNFISLAVFSPGAISTNPGALTGDVAITGMVVRGTANGSPSINGNRQQQNNYIWSDHKCSFCSKAAPAFSEVHFLTNIGESGHREVVLRGDPHIVFAA